MTDAPYQPENEERRKHHIQRLRNVEHRAQVLRHYIEQPSWAQALPGLLFLLLAVLGIWKAFDLLRALITILS